MLKILSLALAFVIFATTAHAAPSLATGKASFDKWDAIITEKAAFYQHPDARFLKAQAWWESDQRYDIYSTSYDTPCGRPSGWTSLQSRSFGLFQVTPACGEGVPQMMRNGRPNMTKDKASPLWKTSVYNPRLNIDRGVAAIAEGFHYFKEMFPGCPTASLVKMAAAGYVGNWEEINSCGDLGNEWMQDYVYNVLRFYNQYYGTYPNYY